MEITSYVIYIYWNTTNKTYYVGQSKNITSRCKSHGTRFSKYNFEIIIDGLTKYEAQYTEIMYINIPPDFVKGYTTLNKASYNPQKFLKEIDHINYNHYLKIHPISRETTFKIKYQTPYETQFTNHTKIWFHYRCICGSKVNFSPASPCYIEDHNITNQQHINFMVEWDYLLEHINLNPVPVECQFISPYYQENPTPYKEAQQTFIEKYIMYMKTI
jgi:hypothetical protein